METNSVKHAKESQNHRSRKRKDIFLFDHELINKKNMKTLQQWFDEYSDSHQNPTNISIHYICVPLIYLSIIGLLMNIPAGILDKIFVSHLPVIENWASVILIFVLLFYATLSVELAVRMFFFSLFCLALNSLLSYYLPLLPFSVIVFVFAWIGQFYGHKVEGKKPSFFKDIQFLLIGPAWVFEKLTKELL